MGASFADALLAYAMRAMEATEIERDHKSLLEEHLEKEREGLEELERHGALLD